MNPTIHIEIRPAYRVAVSLVIAHAFAIGAALVLPPVAGALVVVGLALSVIVQVRQSLGQFPGSLRSLRIGRDGTLSGSPAGGADIQLEVRSARIVFPWLVALDLRDIAGATSHPLVLVGGDQDPEALRNLRAGLRLRQVRRRGEPTGDRQQ